MTVVAVAEPRTQSYRRPKITKKHADFYRKNGYLVVESALTPTEVDALRTETVRICRGQLGRVRGLPPVLPEDRIVLIAGEDPYAYQGIKDIMYSHVRPDREGGCRWPSREDV